MDVVVISLLGDKDVLGELGVGGRIKEPHGDGEPVLVDGVPKQRAATSGAKASADLFRRCKPCDVLGPLHVERISRYVCGCQEVSCLLATLCAVTGIGSFEFAPNLNTNSFAQATSCMKLSHDESSCWEI